MCGTVYLKIAYRAVTFINNFKSNLNKCWKKHPQNFTAQHSTLIETRNVATGGLYHPRDDWWPAYP